MDNGDDEWFLDRCRRLRVQGTPAMRNEFQRKMMEYTFYGRVEVTEQDRTAFRHKAWREVSWAV
jgi:hypothetical protein